jgi:hypothetical protein
MIVLLFENSYRRTSRIAQQVIEGILGNVLDDEANQKLKKDGPKSDAEENKS